MPSVRVPVLSTTRVSIFSNASSASASRISTPARAPRPTPTMIDIGVARPSAHGHAMISTATALTRAWASRGSGPSSAHAANVTAATATTAGTNTAATRSATRWIGARERWASQTSATMCASRVSAPTRSARITKLPVALTVRAGDLASRGLLDRDRLAGDHRLVHRRGALHHDAVHRDLLAGAHPQAVARLAPARAGRRRSPPSGRTARAVFGARPRSARIALPVRARARSSSTCPSRTSAVITAAASKYTATRAVHPERLGEDPGSDRRRHASTRTRCRCRSRSG